MIKTPENSAFQAFFALIRRSGFDIFGVSIPLTRILAKSAHLNIDILSI